ncbi:Cadherin-24 [Liparis tanakae]|uniref:Cadherin-24 n=1 Tax=Liparis tanakae TaxID=230148 RepID=A0A4Z2EB57_9TELE|nr:Cadherin-24 [Liparis tanakae]
MDRETRDQYLVVLQARDMGGHLGGLSGTTTVTVRLSDVNDNPPRFRRTGWLGGAGWVELGGWSWVGGAGRVELGGWSCICASRRPLGPFVFVLQCFLVVRRTQSEPLCVEASPRTTFIARGIQMTAFRLGPVQQQSSHMPAVAQI